MTTHGRNGREQAKDAVSFKVSRAAALAAKQVAKEPAPHSQKGITSKSGKLTVQDHKVRLEE
jgi:hypothetical protein